MRRVVINLVPVSAGGGLQNALSFIRALSGLENNNFKYIFFCREGGLVERELKLYGFSYLSFPGGVVGRIKYEVLYGACSISRISPCAVFTLFGAPPLWLFGVKKISGFAYSNIIQPEIDFWDWLPWYRVISKKLIDFFRYWMARRSDVLVLETDYLLDRARQGVFKGKDLRVVKMAPSSVVVSSLASIGEQQWETSSSSCGEVRVLYLCGPHPNKRVHLLAPLFLELSKLNDGYRLVTTLPVGDYLSLVCREFERLGISYMHENVGPVAPQEVATRLRSVDAVINVAKLESFSNNWVEAWAADLPLIATDALWSRASCGDAAIYVDVENPATSARIIHETLSSRAGRQSLIIEGRKVLLSLPTAEQRTRQYVDIIESSLGGDNR